MASAESARLDRSFRAAASRRIRRTHSAAVSPWHARKTRWKCQGEKLAARKQTGRSPPPAAAAVLLPPAKRAEVAPAVPPQRLVAAGQGADDQRQHDQLPDEETQLASGPTTANRVSGLSSDLWTVLTCFFITQGRIW